MHFEVDVNAYGRDCNPHRHLQAYCSVEALESREIQKRLYTDDGQRAKNVLL